MLPYPDQLADEHDECSPTQVIRGIPGSADGTWWDYAYGGDYGVGPKNDKEGSERVGCFKSYARLFTSGSL